MTAGKFPQPAIFLAAAWLPMAAATAVSQTDFGPVNVGASAAMTVTLTIPSAVTLGGISVATQGVPGLDFTNAGSGTCAAGASYPAGQCTVEVTFKPAFAGKRYGEVLLEGGSGNVIVTANLEGIGSGAQIGFDPGTAIAIDPTVNGNGLKIPFGTAVDGEGNLFITDTIHRRVLEMPAGGGAPIAIDPVVNGEGLSNPGGVTVDGAGDLFISDLDNNFVVELPAGGGAPIAIDPVVNGIGLDYPCGMVVDGAGNLFIADVDKGRVVEVPAGGGAPIAIDPMVNGEKLSYPVTLALDSAGDLFIADEFGQRVVEVPDVAENPSGAGATAIAPMVNGQSFYQPYGVAVDAAGDLFIADAGNDRIVEVPGGGGAPTAFDPTVNGGGLSDPIGIALDAAGDLFIADSLNNRVVEVERSQPPALNFAAAPIGSASSDSPQTVEVENIGNAPLTFSVPATGGNPAVAANFTLDSSGTSACPLVTQGSSEPGTLAAGAACLLPISFAPTAAGSLYGTLTLTDDNLNAAAPGYAVQTVSLSGDAPVASLSAANLWFGAQELGTASAAQQVTLTNAGSAALTITSIAVSGTDASSFLFPNLCGPSLAAGANCVIQGTFKPAAAGPLTAQLTLTDNAGGSTQTIALTGTGVYTPAVMVTPSASSITTAQALTVTVAVSGESGDPPPTGAVTLTIGSYVSAPAALLSGSASIGVPAGSLAVGTDSIVAAYTPDIASSNLYSTASGSSSVVVTAASTAAAPAATTGVASAIAANSATLAGTVNPNGADTEAWFLWGTSSTLSGASQTAMQDLGSTTGVDPATASINGLTPSTTYYFQAVAKNSVGTTEGAIGSFTTTPAPYFTVTGSPVNVAPGATTGNTSTITVTPWYGFTGAVSLSCAITPVAASDPATCSVPASLTVSGAAAQTVTLTVNTTAATALNQPLRLFWLPAGGAVLACILFFGIPLRRRSSLGMLALLAFLAGGVLSCSSGNMTSAPQKITPQVTVTPSSSSITTAQALAVMVAVSAGGTNPTPTGSVSLSSGSYISTATTLSGGSATINLPAGSLVAGTDTLTVNYTPDAASASNFNNASGTGSVTVTVPGNPGTTAGNYTITVTAVSGSTTQTVPVALTVQ